MTKNQERIARHLEREYTQPIRDPLWKHIYLSRSLLPVIDSTPFRKLAHIKQLGTAYLVYPGATHTRFSHSLGVFHIAKRIIRALLDREGLIELSLEGVKAFLCATLLHDIGHFPYTHCLSDLPMKQHETLTGELAMSDPLATIIRERVDADPELVAAIVNVEIPDEGNEELRFFRNILSSALDPDKLDYLCRDAFFCGVPYGLQDIDHVLTQLVPNGNEGLAVEGYGLSALENLLFSKYLMYRSVYWHRTVRIASAMIRKAVQTALSDEVLRPEDLYNLDDISFGIRCASQEYPPFKLVAMTYRRSLYRVICDVIYDEDLETHRCIADAACRQRLETDIAQHITRRGGRRLLPEDVIIDLPEATSFETNIPIRTSEGLKPFTASETVFTPQVIQNFTRSIRHILVMVAPDIKIERHDKLEWWTTG